MTSPDSDRLIVDLGLLMETGPETVLDRISASWVRVPGPVGELYVASTNRGIAYVRTADAVRDSDREFVRQFRERFGLPSRPAPRPPAGLLPALHTQRAGKLAFDLRELPELDRDVLTAVRTIPRGQVRPYAWIAHQIGRPGAVRAVGSALGRNPVPVLIPCHRVIRSDGSTGEYVFGSELKQALLTAEGANLDEVHELARHGVHYLASDTTGVVCFPTCPNARRITQPHRHGFRSMRLAEQAGYRACLHCRPVSVAGAA